MTEQEKRIEKQTKDAIEVLGFLKKDFENKAKPRCKFARVRAGLFFGIKALEKQIAKKPYVKSSDYNFKGYYCPCCDGYVRSVHTRMEIIREEDVYCGRCGQHLSWE